MLDFMPLVVIVMLAAPVDAGPLALAPVAPMEITAPADWPFDGAVVEPAPPVDLQMRIEQRVIIRVPRQNSARQALSDLRALPSKPQKYKTRKIGKCIPMSNIAGVQITPEDDLMLYLRDRRMVRAELEKSCRGRDFYSGFYLEKSKDGQFCRDRDVLHSRSGAKCEVDDMHELVADK